MSAQGIPYSTGGETPPVYHEGRAGLEEEARIRQANDIAYTVIEVAKNKAPEEFVTLDFRYGIADALWNAGYRKVAPPRIQKEGSE